MHNSIVTYTHVSMRCPIHVYTYDLQQTLFLIKKHQSKIEQVHVWEPLEESIMFGNQIEIDYTQKLIILS